MAMKPSSQQSHRRTRCRHGRCHWSAVPSILMNNLLEDLLQDLRDAGVELVPWEQIASSLKDSVMAVAYAAGPSGVPAQVFLRPLANVEMAIVVARDVQRRLKAEAAGDANVFESYDPVNNRKVALIYDLTLEIPPARRADPR